SGSDSGVHGAAVPGDTAVTGTSTRTTRGRRARPLRRSLDRPTKQPPSDRLRHASAIPPPPAGEGQAGVSEADNAEQPCPARFFGWSFWPAASVCFSGGAAGYRRRGRDREAGTGVRP